MALMLITANSQQTLVRAIGLIMALVALIHTAGGASRITVRDRHQAAGRASGRSRRTSSCAMTRHRPGCWG